MEDPSDGINLPPQASDTPRASTSSGFTALPMDTRLDGRYVIDAVIAAGGFGITYVARHAALDSQFAIKEHFPRQFAFRDGNTGRVTASDAPTYRWALDRFLSEARALAKCRHPNIVTVTDIFEANGTAYMVLSFEDGQSLKNWMAQLGRSPTQTELDGILLPLLDALAYVHEQNLLHRDIAPDNIIIRRDGTPCLVDFGAARAAIGARSALMSAIVKSGYSPPEQYTTEGRSQGPWSDIYALSATIYTLIARKPPLEATQRAIGEPLDELSHRPELKGQYRSGFLFAIDTALSMKPADRPQSVAVWRAMLFGANNPDAAVVASGNGRGSERSAVSIASVRKAFSVNEKDDHRGTPSKGALARWVSRRSIAAIAALALLGGLTWFFSQSSARFRTSTRVEVWTDPSSDRQTSIVSACDKGAAVPGDSLSKFVGVELENLDLALLQTCRGALAAASSADRPRIATQLGRLMLAAGDAAGAHGQYLSAGNYPEALNASGDLAYSGTSPVALDLTRACSLYKQAMASGNANGTANYGVCRWFGLGGVPLDKQEAVILWRKAGESGSRDSLVALGHASQDRGAASINRVEAAAWFERARVLGAPEAMIALARAYEAGDGVAKDPARAKALYVEAIPLLRRRADRFDASATSTLGDVTYNGDGVEKDLAEAVRLQEMAARLGSMYAMNELSNYYQTGGGIPQDYARALRWAKMAADRGYPAASNNVGDLYYWGHGVEQSYQEARNWYQKAATQGHVEAFNNLGHLFDKGYGVTSDLKLAFSWYQRAADRNHAAATNNIGDLYYGGRGVEQSYLNALEWYQRAVTLGSTEAMNNIGHLYSFGYGVTKDDTTAASWYARGSEKGHAGSTRNLAIGYENGTGVAKDLAEAARLFQIAAAQGDGAAMLHLGQLYETGSGVTRDCTTARSWYQKAADKNEGDAKEKLAALDAQNC